MTEILFENQTSHAETHYHVPRSMRAAILIEQKKPLEMVDNVKLPNTLSVGQVLVKIIYSGICGSQLGEIDGVKGENKYLPHLLGHEASGKVMQIGPGVRHVKPGDKVVLHWRKSVGIESVAPHYVWNDKKVNAGWVTTFNEYAIVSENRLTPIPAHSNMKIAALFGCAVTTGFGVITRNAKLTIGESVVIFGAGGLGLNMVQAAAMVNAYPIIAVDLHQNRLDIAKALGATHTIQSTKQDPKEAIAAILKEHTLDVFIDNTGNPEIIQMGYKMVHNTGRVVLVGVPKFSQNISIHSLDLHFGKQLIGSHGGDALPHVDIPKYNHLYLNNKLDLDSLITRTYPFEALNQAIQEMRSGELAGRAVIKVNDDE